MSDVEIIIKQEAGVKDHESASPPTVGLKAGAFAELGTLILTNKRLVYISKGGVARAAAWGVGTVFAAQAIEKRVSKAEIDELTTREGSYFIPLQNITSVEAGRKMGQSYIKVDGVTSGKPIHSYVVDGGSNNQDWVNAINQTKSGLYSNVVPQTANLKPHQTQTSSSKSICQKCGTPANSGSRFCASCGTPLTQTQTSMPVPPPPPPPPTQVPLCPDCRRQIRYIEQYKRWYCDNEKKYL